MEGKDTAGNTGTVSRRLKEKLAVEDIYGVEESEEVDTEKIEDCEIIDTEGNVISSTDSSDIGDWEKRHNEIEEQREKIRNRVRKTRSGNGVIREASTLHLELKLTISGKQNQSQPYPIQDINKLEYMPV